MENPQPTFTAHCTECGSTSFVLATSADDTITCCECKAAWGSAHFHSIARWQAERYLRARDKRAEIDPAPSPHDSVYIATYPDGSQIHILFDGRTVKLKNNGPRFTLHYDSYGPGQYETDVYLIGLSKQPHLFEAWSYDRNGLRSYAFHKIRRLIDLQTGHVFTGEQLRKFLGGSRVSG